VTQPEDEAARIAKNQSLSIARAAILLQCLQHLAIEIGRARSGRGDELPETDIRSSTLQLLKEAEFSGMSYEDQSRITAKAIDELEYMISSVFREIKG